MSRLRRRAWLAGAAIVGLIHAAPVFSAGVAGSADQTGVAARSAPDVPAAVLFAGTPGRFEVVTVSPALGPLSIELGEAVWTHLADVLALPARGFATPITVRLVPESLWTHDEPYRVWLEAAGLVTLQVRTGDGVHGEQLVPALVSALLVKRAAINVDAGLGEGAPLWLELGCTQWVLARLQPSLHDQWQQQSAAVRAPPLLALLNWRADRPRPPAVALASYAALQWLHGIGRGNGEWTEFLRHQLAGRPPLMCLGVLKAAGWTSIEDVELDWEVAFQELRSRSVLPLLSINDSRELLRRWSRIVLHDTTRQADVLVGVEELWAARADPAVRSLAAGRTAEIELRLGAMHPFYRNAANSLGRFFLVLRQGKSSKDIHEAWSWYESDWSDAETLREDSARLLDRAQSLPTLR